jgi:transposase
MKQLEKMKIINPHAAGIDIGSKSHFVAVGQSESQVKEFNVYKSGQDALIAFLKQEGVKTVAMESKGSYWQSIFRELQLNGFEVMLVSGQQTKNVRAKTDVKDCQWIQKLHTLGLLRGCYLPSETTLKLRTLSRHRSSLIENASSITNKMQKTLRLMSFRLDAVINDITGKSGIKIIEAILNGELNGEKLSLLADARVRKSKEEISDALQGNYNDELMFELKQCYFLYKTLQQAIAECDNKMEGVLLEITKAVTKSAQATNKKQLKGKNQQRFDLPNYSNKLLGVDLYAIEGVSSGTVMTFISEIGNDIHKFSTAKEFTSWLRLAPNNRISGGKIIGSRTPKGKNKFAIALRNAANTIERLKGGMLNAFFKRIAYKKGRAAAITATARKLAVIIWNMTMKRIPYLPADEGLYKEKIRQNKIYFIKKSMQKHGISTLELSAT